MSTLKDLAQRTADYLNNYQNARYGSLSSSSIVDHVTILKFWKSQLVSVPYMARPLPDWSESQRDRHFMRMLLDTTYFDGLYSFWKSKLGVGRLPYFSKNGTPRDTCSSIATYTINCMELGVTAYPTLKDLQEFSKLLKAVRELRSYEKAFQSAHMEHCSCWAKSFGLLVMNTGIHTFDKMQREKWCMEMARVFASPPKCGLHTSFAPKRSLDDLLMSSSDYARKNNTRRRSRSSSGAYARREALNAYALMLPPLQVERILGENLENLSLLH